MRKISKNVKDALLLEPDICARRSEEDCRGRITWEHAWIYAGRQIDEVWAIIKLCAYHHEVDEFQDCGDLDKDLNKYLSLKKADLEKVKKKYPRKDWDMEWKRLSAKYSTY